MNHTQHSLLERAKVRSEHAWTEIADLYHPLILRWLARLGLNPHDADEVAQEVMRVMVERLPEFQHSGRPGAFRKWLRLIAANQTKSFWRRQARPGQQSRADAASVDTLTDPSSSLTKAWNEEHDRYVLACLLERTLQNVNNVTACAFRALVLEERPAEEVAEEFDLTVGAVYSVKSRVLSILRREAKGMVDEVYLQ